MKMPHTPKAVNPIVLVASVLVLALLAPRSADGRRQLVVVGSSRNRFHLPF